MTHYMDWWVWLCPGCCNSGELESGVELKRTVGCERQNNTRGTHQHIKTNFWSICFHSERTGFIGHSISLGLITTQRAFTPGEIEPPTFRLVDNPLYLSIYRPLESQCFFQFYEQLVDLSSLCSLANLITSLDDNEDPGNYTTPQPGSYPLKHFPVCNHWHSEGGGG